MSESARDPYVGLNQHISQRANREQHPTYTIGRITSLDPIKIRADGIDLEKEDLRVAESMYPNFLADVKMREENGIETLLPEKLLAKWGSFIVTGLGMLVAGVIICAVEQPWSVPVEFSPGMVVALAAMVVLGTFLAYLFYLQGVKEAGAMRAGLVGCIEPVAATVFSAVWLKTAVTWADIVGMVLIIGMVVLVTVKPKDEKRGASGLSQNQG